jgi:NADPH2:quinone reductase
MLPRLPAILGNGVAGRIAEVSDGGDQAQVGRQVMTSLDGTGGYAEQAIADADRVVEIPGPLGTPEALALLADGRTAVLLARSVGIEAGQTVLVEAAAGGVGSLLVQLVRLAGARVLAAAGGPHKLEVARELGAEVLIDYSRAHWADQIEEGVDVVFDGVGGEIGTAAFRLVRPGGSFYAFGMSSGAFADIDSAASDARRIKLIRGLRPTPEELRTALRDALELAESARLRPVIGQVFALSDAAAAHSAIEQRVTVGKTLLRVRRIE